MKFNRRGDGYIAGSGGAPGSYNGIPYAVATDGKGDWYDDDRLIVQLAATHTLAILDLRTWVAEEIQPTRGATLIAAGGGKMLAHLPGVGAYGDLPGAPLPAAGVPINAVGRDGTRVYTPDAQFGWGLHGINPGGSEFDIPLPQNGEPPVYHGAPPQGDSIQVLGPGQVVWKGGAFGRLPPTPALADGINPRVFTVRGVEYWLYWSDSMGLIVQEPGATEGIVLEKRPIAFHYDAVETESGVARIGWSITNGEGPTDVVVVELDDETGLTYPVQPLGWDPWPAELVELVPPPQPPVVDPPPDVTAHYEPTSGVMPLTVLAVASIQPDSGPCDRFEWLQSWQGAVGFEPFWQVVADNPASDPDHHYVFDNAGEVAVALRVTGPGGVITVPGPTVYVTPPPIDPPIPPVPGGHMTAAYGPLMPGFASGKEHDNGDGTISVEKPNGKWLCVTPDGNVEERDSPGGPWESFKKANGCLIAERDGGAKGTLSYVFGWAEAK